MTERFSLLNTTKSNVPISPLLFARIKNHVLGTDYELSLVFVTPKKSHALNLAHRGKDKPTNILSFPLDAKAGEIFICPSYAKKEAKNFERTYPNYLAFLFIHGLVHLKGLDHGSTMEKIETSVRKRFLI